MFAENAARVEFEDEAEVDVSPISDLRMEVLGVRPDDDWFSRRQDSNEVGEDGLFLEGARGNAEMEEGFFAGGDAVFDESDKLGTYERLCLRIRFSNFRRAGAACNDQGNDQAVEDVEESHRRSGQGQSLTSEGNDDQD